MRYVPDIVSWLFFGGLTCEAAFLKNLRERAVLCAVFEKESDSFNDVLDSFFLGIALTDQPKCRAGRRECAIFLCYFQ